jgi:hypothetical protein
VDTYISRTKGKKFHCGSEEVTPELIQEVNTVSNKILRAIDLWMDSIVGGYITEFFVDCAQSYSVVEREFFKSPHRIYGKQKRRNEEWMG